MRLRELFDADRHEFDLNPTEIPTETNRFEVNCEICGELYFVDEVTFDAVAEAIREGLDNPFVCTGCEQNYEEENYG